MNYCDGGAFRRALEDRLRWQSRETGTSLVRLRKLIAFDRLLARLVETSPNRWMLKGGVALQMRLGVAARTTRDVDLLLMLPYEQSHEALVQAARVDLGDWFEFTIGAASPSLPGPNQGGIRLSALCLLDSRVFESFHIDVGSGDPVVESADWISMPPLLAFAGVSPTPIPCYPLTQHLAEKFHAYSRTRASGPNTRVKDLIDILLICQHTSIDGPSLRAALIATFTARGDVDLPEYVPAPPHNWVSTFRRMAGEVGLSHIGLADGIEEVHRFLDPVLSGQTEGIWQPDRRVWD